MDNPLHSPPAPPNLGDSEIYDRAKLALILFDQYHSNIMAHKAIRGTTPQVEQAARKHRQNLTPAEAKLWEALRGHKLRGLKFRCQHPVGQFILDFYCPAHKLVIEVDGDSHHHRTQYDQARSEHLKSYGYQVLRFSNEEVLQDLPTVLTSIKNFAQTQFPPKLGG